MKNVKIINMKKFARSIVVLIGIVIAITFLLTKATLSHNDKEKIDYATISVAQGDTLWQIATNQQQNNPYFTEKDVRFIVSELRKINNLNNCNLQVGQELKVPII